MRKLVLFSTLVLVLSASAQSINTSKPTSLPENNLLSEIAMTYPIEEVTLTVSNSGYGAFSENATWEFSAEKIINEKGEYQMFLDINISKDDKRTACRISENELKSLISEMKRINAAPYPANNPQNINGKFITSRKAEFAFHVNANKKASWTLYTPGGYKTSINLDNFDVFFEHFTKAAAKLDSYK